MSHSMLDLAGPWRFDQLDDLPDDGRRYEVVDGHLVVTPPPSSTHQIVSNRLARQLGDDCPPEWEPIVENALQLGTDGRIPDLGVIRRRPLPPARRRPLYSGPAEFGLVVEVTSPSTRKTDLFAKPGEYAEAGIPLFWRVEIDPDLVVHAFRLDSGTDSGTGAYVAAAVITGAGGLVPVPWGETFIDLEQVRTG